MNAEDMAEVRGQLQAELNRVRPDLVRHVVEEVTHEYKLVHKDDWRAFVSRTIATLVLAGGVPLATILWFIYSGTAATIYNKLNEFATKAETRWAALEKENELTLRKLVIRDEKGGEVIVLEAAPAGNCALTFFDRGGVEKLRLYVETDDRGGTVMAFNGRPGARPTVIQALSGSGLSPMEHQCSPQPTVVAFRYRINGSGFTASRTPPWRGTPTRRSVGGGDISPLGGESQIWVP